MFSNLKEKCFEETPDFFAIHGRCNFDAYVGASATGNIFLEIVLLHDDAQLVFTFHFSLVMSISNCFLWRRGKTN